MILVTGGAGYIGGTVARYLVSKDEEVVVLDSLISSNEEFVPKNTIFYKGDISDEALLEEILSKHKIDVCLHFAAFIEVSESVSNPEKYFYNNFYKTSVLFTFLKNHGVNKIIFSSTAAVYGIPEYTPIDEAHKIKPINPYGASKYFVETLLESFSVAYDFKYVALRYFNASGAWGEYGENHNPETHLIPIILDVALGVRDKLFVNGNDYDTHDGTCVRDYIHVYDLATAHYKALKYLQDGGESKVINLGNGTGFSILEVIKTCEKITGKEIPYTVREKRPGDPATLVACDSLAKEVLGWTPRYPNIEDIIESAYEWHKIRIKEY